MRLAAGMHAPLVIYLEGPLGAGKTTLVRALIRAKGYPGRVKSPTYGLLERYDLNTFSAFHLDLYRVEDEGELEFLALRDLIGDDAVLLIEWPGRGGSAIPPADLVVRFSDSVSQRSLTAFANSAAGEALLADLGDS